MSDVLAVVGSTFFIDVTAATVARDVIVGVFERRRPDVVVSGGAAGIDTLAVQLAEQHGIDVVEYKPARRRWKGPDGYQERNDRIADACTRLLRIHDRWSTTYGSGYTHDRAKAQRKVCWSLMLPANAQHGLLWVVYGTHTLALVVQDGHVVDAPPHALQLGWRGRNADDLVAMLARRRFNVRWVPHGATPPTT